MSPLNSFHPPQSAECWPLTSETEHWSIITSSPITHTLHISCLVSIYPFHKHSSSSVSNRGCSGEQTVSSVWSPLGRFSLVLWQGTTHVTWSTCLSMGFLRQEIWRELPCPPPGDLPDPGIKPVFPAAPAWAGEFWTTSATLGALRLKIFQI